MTDKEMFEYVYETDKELGYGVFHEMEPNPTFAEWKQRLQEKKSCKKENEEEADIDDSDDVEDDNDDSDDSVVDEKKKAKKESVNESIGFVIGGALVTALASYIAGRKHAKESFSQRNAYIEKVFEFLESEDKIYELKQRGRDNLAFKIQGVQYTIVYTPKGAYKLTNQKTKKEVTNDNPSGNMKEYNLQLLKDIAEVSKKEA